jgi:hypothetical protein
MFLEGSYFIGRINVGERKKINIKFMVVVVVVVVRKGKNNVGVNKIKNDLSFHILVRLFFVIFVVVLFIYIEYTYCSW